MNILKRKGTELDCDHQIKEIRVQADTAGIDSLDWLSSNEDYCIIKYKRSSRTALNRFNLLWVFPLFLIASPIQWMLHGDTGFKLDSRIGQVVDKLVNLRG